MKKVTGLICVVGSLLAAAPSFATRDEAKRLSDAANDAIAAGGLDSICPSLRDHSNADWRSGDVYVWVLDSAGTIICDGGDVTVEGLNLVGIQDESGHDLGEMFLGAPPEGAWIAYEWQNPKSGSVETKSSWVIKTDTHVIGAGTFND